MNSERFSELGAALFAERWKSALARRLGISLRHVQDIAAGNRSVTDRIADKMIVLVEQKIAELQAFVEQEKN